MNTTTAAVIANDFADLTDSDLALQTGHVFDAHQTAMNAAEAAADHLLRLTLEQIARRVHRTHPDANTLYIDRILTFHTDEDTNERSTDCLGHDAIYTPDVVLDINGDTLTGFEPLHPVHYLVERLTPLLVDEDTYLIDLTTRELFTLLDEDAADDADEN